MAFAPDPILGTEIMDALNISADDLSIPRNLTKFKEIYSFFEKYPAPVNKILSLTTNKSGDKLDVVWSWIALNRRRESVVAELNPEDFAEDIAQEIASKKLPREYKKRIRQGIDEQKKRLEAELKYNQDSKKAVSKLNLEKIEGNLSEIDSIDHMLETI